MQNLLKPCNIPCELDVVLTELHNFFPAYNMLGYATAAKRISALLGPLFVGSKIDDISTIKGT